MMAEKTAYLASAVTMIDMPLPATLSSLAFADAASIITFLAHLLENFWRYPPNTKALCCPKSCAILAIKIFCPLSIAVYAVSVANKPLRSMATPDARVSCEVVL